MGGETANGKILVTGGTGFIGRVVLDNLIASGVKPQVISRNPPLEFLGKYKEKIGWSKIDLTDGKALAAFFAEFQPEKIIHLAGSTGKNDSSAADFERVNFTATVKILELARAAQVQRIVITGTADEYGFQPAPQNETLAAMPLSEYAISKNRAVNHALTLYEKYRLPIVILRPFTVYGIGQPAAMFVSQAIECAVENVPLAMSNGTQKRDLLFVADLADAMIKALTAANIEGEIFNVGSGDAIQLKILAEKIWRIAGADIENLKIGARQTGANELHDTQADVSKITELLGWTPQVSLDEGLKIIIEARKNKQK